MQHSIPFEIRLSPEDTVGTVKKRLQARLGVGDKDWSKTRLFVCTDTVQNELTDDSLEIGREKIERDVFLGLEIADRASTRRHPVVERSIKIHN
jgi:ubiquitin carboxyl-terminal hydrolase 7